MQGSPLFKIDPKAEDYARHALSKVLSLVPQGTIPQYFFDFMTRNIDEVLKDADKFKLLPVLTPPNTVLRSLALKMWEAIYVAARDYGSGAGSVSDFEKAKDVLFALREMFREVPDRNVRR